MDRIRESALAVFAQLVARQDPGDVTARAEFLAEDAAAAFDAAEAFEREAKRRLQAAQVANGPPTFASCSCVDAEVDHEGQALADRCENLGDYELAARGMDALKSAIGNKFKVVGENVVSPAILRAYGRLVDELATVRAAAPDRLAAEHADNAQAAKPAPTTVTLLAPPPGMEYILVPTIEPGQVWQHRPTPETATVVEVTPDQVKYRWATSGRAYHLGIDEFRARFSPPKRQGAG